MVHHGLLRKMETKSAGSDDWAALPVVTSVRFQSSPSRRKPKAGDRRTTKAHGLQIRVWLRAPCGAMRVSNGRPCFDWVKAADLAPEHSHHLTSDERKQLWACP